MKVLENEVARLQKECESWRLVYDKDSQPFDQELRAALLHVLAQYDGDEYREVLSGFAARLREANA